VSARLSLRLMSHGVRIAVASDDATLLDAAQPFLPPIRTAIDGRVHATFHLSRQIGPEEQPLFSLSRAGRVLSSSASLRKVLAALEWESSLLLAERARDRIFVHAGVVEWKGKAIVLPGRSFSGKSTLVTAFIRAGCAYLSDEYAILDAAGGCHAHPRRLSLRVAGGIEKRTAEELGGCTRRERLRIGLVLVTRYCRGATWQPSPLSPGEAMMALLQHTVAARSRTREVLAVLRAAMAGVEGMEGIRGDAADLVRALLDASAGETPSYAAC
jgi:hypothetical protein